MFKRFGFGRRPSMAVEVPMAIDDRPSTAGNVAQFEEEPSNLPTDEMAGLEDILLDVDVQGVDMAIENGPEADVGSDWNGCGGCPVAAIGGDFVPPRFAFGCSKRSDERWASALQWREVHQIDHILATSRVHFHAIKAAWSHFFCARTRTESRNLVVYEHVGGLNKALAVLDTQHNIAFSDVMAHYLFLTEFQWACLDRRPFDQAQPTVGQMVKILDFDGMALADCKNADFRTFVTWTMRTIGQHYPERCAAIYIINTPPWFATFWRVIQRLISDVTKQKIRICPSPKDYVRRLTAWLGQEHLPVALGGTVVVNGTDALADDEAALHAFVRERLD
ncbi:SEC14 cytosolic factor [Achlya hypogyna]|uniref:SEC14 cytosolic factor n=1 Tax=Achlya hypogyna TaxID=1202772 RepID=A0A1V9YMX3_ACHHY|nr:SEC14 cytosolic factor [Achlya hypogyna]